MRPLGLHDSSGYPQPSGRGGWRVSFHKDGMEAVAPQAVNDSCAPKKPKE